ncbi:Digeranylgeranylglycerophospholipid reductase [uncultured archaeon]|nr:Digeranylgeranylglycerophospholipid reductase [uncultured archaeon]
MSGFFDVTIVGGSAIGGASAAECARRGLSTVILEEDPVVGKFRRCTSICSESGLRSTGIPFSEATLNYINGAVIHSQNEDLTLKLREKKAIVFDRQVFDERSVSRAVSAGAELRLGSRVTSFRANNLSTSEGSIGAKVIVGADGVASSTAAAYQFPVIKRFVYCYEAEISNADVAHKDLVEVFFDNRMLPGFFGWIVPVDEKTARVGFGVDDPSKMMRAKNDFFSRKEVSPYKSGDTVRDFHASIPARPRASTQKGNVILVGDAAGQTKSTTGGGLVFGSLCAKEAGASIAGHLSDGKELDYEKRWRSKYGLTLSLHRNLRRLADRMDDSLIDAALSLNRNPLSLSLLSRFGDMDFLFRF